MQARSIASINAAITSVMATFCVPLREGADGGAVGASSARYLRTVRQSQRHSRPISAYVMPVACNCLKRRIFIQKS